MKPGRESALASTSSWAERIFRKPVHHVPKMPAMLTCFTKGKKSAYCNVTNRAAECKIVAVPTIIRIRIDFVVTCGTFHDDSKVKSLFFPLFC
mmetsp:Transcript_35059/g.73620  ORF Transcript_35059/g.73620 Transcript_35059/m.73620 type:complete len:93 (+) Transcript_35059:226-504(+)